MCTDIVSARDGSLHAQPTLGFPGSLILATERDGSENVREYHTSLAARPRYGLAIVCELANSDYSVNQATGAQRGCAATSRLY